MTAPEGSEYIARSTLAYAVRSRQRLFCAEVEMSEENPLALSHQLLWEGLPATTKGPRPTLTLGQVVEAGIEIADTEGIEALSMRKLAAALGMGTMSLYRYVPSK